MSIRSYITIGVAVIVSVILLFLLVERRFLKEQIEILSNRDTITNTIILGGDPYPVETIVERHYPYKVIDSVPVPANVDTAYILRDYFAKNLYNRVLKDDTSAYVAILDTVSQNRLLGAVFTFQNRRPTSVTTNTVLPANTVTLWGVKAGMGVGYTQGDTTLSLIPSALVTYKQKHSIGYGYDFGHKQHNITYLQTIKLKK